MKLEELSERLKMYNFYFTTWDGERRDIDILALDEYEAEEILRQSKLKVEKIIHIRGILSDYMYYI